MTAGGDISLASKNSDQAGETNKSVSVHVSRSGAAPNFAASAQHGSMWKTVCMRKLLADQLPYHPPSSDEVDVAKKWHL